MKTLIIFLFAFSILTNVNAQTNSPDPKTELLNLLKNKHDYERKLSLGKKFNPEPYRTQYLKAFAGIKGNKGKVLSYINSSLKVDSIALSNEFVFYKYESPLSSFNDVKNRITLLTYFKIVKYSLENSKDILPSLSEISFK